ncbi:response regulator [uncultured Desulfuromusa sp.]|uniref:response regulator n=1 Tax=uncultured Desulfuromusa sp. TaxID=219183 RepID=UPI002AA93CC4|nr:response regulator [uncultured Desulfuromusa sp.]
MKILIVEDDHDKIEKINEFLEEKYGAEISVIVSESLRSALHKLQSTSDIDLVILDMSLPNFDINKQEPGGGTPESFAGKELMAQMSLRGIKIPVVVLTQYAVFDEGKITLDELKSEFANDFEDFYLGSVYYNAAVDGWKVEISDLIDNHIKG